jgi:hypothetical protein
MLPAANSSCTVQDRARFTTGYAAGIFLMLRNQGTVPEMREELPDVEEIDRTGVNSWEDAR